MLDSLGNGEKAVISLAIKKKIDRILIDEAKPRIVVRFKGLKQQKIEVKKAIHSLR